MVNSKLRTVDRVVAKRRIPGQSPREPHFRSRSRISARGSAPGGRAGVSNCSHMRALDDSRGSGGHV